MIQAEFNEWVAEDGVSLELLVDGHADYAEHGKDIVCAGVSAITQALSGFIENHDECEGECQENDCGGHMHIYALQADDKAYAAFEMAFIGLLQIETAHPGFVTVSKKITRRK